VAACTAAKSPSVLCARVLAHSICNSKVVLEYLQQCGRHTTGYPRSGRTGAGSTRPDRQTHTPSRGLRSGRAIEIPALPPTAAAVAGASVKSNLRRSMNSSTRISICAKFHSAAPRQGDQRGDANSGTRDDCLIQELLFSPEPIQKMRAPIQKPHTKCIFIGKR
jgi:hypothetical protein